MSQPHFNPATQPAAGERIAARASEARIAPREPATDQGDEANAYVVEVHGQTVGIVARDGQYFRFHASAHRFNALDGRRSKSPREAERAALALTRPAQRNRRAALAAGAFALLPG